MYLISTIGPDSSTGIPPVLAFAALACVLGAMAAGFAARREDLEAYIKRIKNLEDLTNSFKGVQQSFAIQAGREVRVIVEPEKVDDAAAMVMARNISKKIESDLQYPGQIRVTVIRETRCVEFAR